MWRLVYASLFTDRTTDVGGLYGATAVRGGEGHYVDRQPRQTKRFPSDFHPSITSLLKIHGCLELLNSCCYTDTLHWSALEITRWILALTESKNIPLSIGKCHPL